MNETVQKSGVTAAAVVEKIDDHGDIAEIGEVGSDFGWDTANPIANNDCVHHSEDFVENVKHYADVDF